MANFTILAGDFGKSPAPTIAGQALQLPRSPGSGMRSFCVDSPYESVHASEIASLETVAQASGKSFGGAAAAGIAGGLLLGGVGTVAGVLAGGNKDAVTFQMILHDGRKLIGSAKPTVFQKIQTAEFMCRGHTPLPKVVPKPVTSKGVAVKVGLVALLLVCAYVGASMFMEHLGL